ncbi:hypothetical protein F2Q69_00054472 [Brassica cretica]|uniref:Uncharacterized protein n=1 Tax=Brassica cretica TaxID=69181 RepID=A0A8S9N3I7_BRACR|nr:hypothetical protein F2Q69_00054472 [Brassica cretica]
MTPKSNRKAKVPTNKRGREIEQESSSSPPPAPKKRVNMISWGQNSNTTDEIKSQTERKIRFEISVVIRTLENHDEVTPPPRVTPYNPKTKPPYVKISNFKRKNKMTKICELLEKPTQKKDRMQTLNRNMKSSNTLNQAAKINDRLNDIDPIGPDSGAGVTPTGLTGANDATETADPTQRIPPIGTSSQDRSLPINKTSIPERAGARVWNRPGDRSSSDDLNRSQSRPISPTPLAQTRGELIELRGMMKTLIDEIHSQRISNEAISNRLDQAERELAEHRAANIRYRNQTPSIRYGRRPTPKAPDCSALQRSQAQYLDATREKIHNDSRRRA